MEGINIEFIGIADRDYDGCYWSVDEETYRKIAGEEYIEVAKDECREGLFKLYPEDIYRFNFNEEREIKLKIKMSIEIIE